MSKAGPTITAEKLSAWTELTDRRHRQIAAEGFFPPPIRGVYQLDATMKGLFKYYRGLQNTRTGSLAEEKLLKLTAERKLVDIALSKAQREVMSTADIQKEWSDTILIVRQKLLGIPPKVAPRLPFLRTQVEMEAELLKEIEEALTDLAKPLSIEKPETNNEKE